MLEARFIQEVQYPEWLANIVVVSKKSSKWHVYVDFTDLIEVYPKNNFSLPRINQIADAMAGHELLSFLDAFFGYNQIAMYPLDVEKMTFIPS